MKIWKQKEKKIKRWNKSGNVPCRVTVQVRDTEGPSGRGTLARESEYREQKVKSADHDSKRVEVSQQLRHDLRTKVSRRQLHQVKMTSEV